MDLFSRQRSFFMKGQPIFYTAYGGLFSLGIAIFSILFFLYLGTSWITEGDMTINKFQMFNDDTLNWNVSAKMIIGIPHSLIDKVVFYRDFSVYKESPNFHECSVQEFTNFNESKTANISLSYYCGDLMFPGLYDHSLVLAKCSDDDNVNLGLTPNLNCSIDSNTENFFEYMILTHRFNTFENPQKMTKLLIQNNDPKEENVRTIYLSYNKLVQYDQFQRIKEITYFTDIVNMDPPDATDSAIFQINIVKDSEDYSNLSNLQIEVQGQKISTILAMTLVIVNIIFQICFYVNNMISDFLLQKYLLSLFKDDLDIWVKISTIKGSEKNDKIISGLSNGDFICNVFSLKNNFLFHLGIGLDFHTKKILHILHEEIKNKLSIETIQEKKFIFLKQETNSKGFFVKISNFLKSCDFMAPGFSFVIKKREKFKTSTGIFLTILYYCLLVVLFFFLGRDFWFKTNPHIYQIQSEDYNNKYDFDYDIPIMLYFPKEIAPFHNITYFNRSIAAPALTNFTQCTPYELAKFKKNEDSKLSYWCSNVKYYFTLKPDLWEDVYISVMECSNLINSGFTNTGCIVNNFTSNNFYNVTIGTAFISKSIDIFALDLGVKDVVFDRNFTLSDMISNNFEYDFMFTRQDVNDNSGSFFDTQEITRYATFYNNTVFYFGSDLDNIADFYFRFQIHLQWTRVYIKFSEALAEITALAHLFWFIFYFVNQFFDDYFFINLFKKEFINKYFAPDKAGIEAQNDLTNLIQDQEAGTGKIAMGEAVKKKVFTFKNYVIYKLFGKILWRNFFNLYETIYKEMITCASLEEIFKKKINKNQDSKIAKFFSSFDYLGENRLIYYNSSNKYVTPLGGLLSIVTFSLIFIFIIVFGSNFWYQMNPKITSYPARFYEMDPNDYKMNIPMAIDYSLNATDYLFFSNINTEKNEFEVDFAMRNCGFNDSAFFNVSFNSENKFRCSNVNQVLLFNYVNLGSVDGNFLLTDCAHAKNCKMNSSSNYYSTPADLTINFGFLFPISVFNQYDPYNPITQEWIKYRNTSIMKYFPKAEYDIINNQLYDDHGWVFPDSKRHDYTSIINVNLKPDKRERGLYICFTYVAQNVRIMSRTYMKFPELLANIFAMLNLINQVVFFFYKLINRYKFHTYLYENTKPINNPSKIKIQLPFYRFISGMYFGFLFKKKNYDKIERLFKDVFSLETILSSEINERALTRRLSTMTDSKKLTIVKQETLSQFCKTVNNYEMVISTTKGNNDYFIDKEKIENNEIIISTYNKKIETEFEKIETIEEKNEINEVKIETELDKVEIIEEKKEENEVKDEIGEEKNEGIIESYMFHSNENKKE